MQRNEALSWLQQGKHRCQILTHLRQPMTAKQLSIQRALPLDSCSTVLLDCERKGLVQCLNPASRRSRLYWFTGLGIATQARLREEHGLPALNHDFPRAEWELFGWVCYTHRAAIIKTMTRPLYAGAIKKKARFDNPTLRMSANNVRDIMKLLLQKGLVSRQKTESTRVHYQLTDIGWKLRQLLVNAERQEGSHVVANSV